MSLPSCEDFSELARSSGFHAETIFDTAAGPLLRLEKSSDTNLAVVLISAGIHGDEPAPVTALYQLVESGFFSAESFNWRIFPILNPTGLRQGTRVNAEGIDLNRDFLGTRSPEISAYKRSIESEQRIDMSLNLHEDWEAKGFYLYALSPTNAEEKGRAIVETVREKGPIEQSELIDGHPSSSGGLILPLEFINDDSLSDGWPEAIHLYRAAPHLHFTMESPSCLPIETRVGMQIAAVKKAVNLLASLDTDPGSFE